LRHSFVKNIIIVYSTNVTVEIVVRRVVILSIAVVIAEVTVFLNFRFVFLVGK